MKIVVDAFPGRYIKHASKKYLYFGGTSYLGMQSDPFFQKKYVKNIRKLGNSYGASRHANIQISVYDKVEKELATWVECQDAITVSSGYLAGQLLSDYLVSTGHTLFALPGTHSALLRDSFLPYPSADELKRALKNHLDSHPKFPPVVLLDSVDFSGSNYPDFTLLQELPLNKCIVVADDSHGLGIVGNNGQGIYQKLLSYKPKELLVCASMGKALGVDGGAIFGNKNTLDAVRQTAFFYGASPASPAAMATFYQSQNLYKKKRRRLNRNIDIFLNHLDKNEDFTYIPNLPVFSFDDDKLVAYLFQNYILVTNFEYPSSTNTLKSRIVLTASHKERDILQLTSCINTFYNKNT